MGGRCRVNEGEGKYIRRLGGKTWGWQAAWKTLT